MAGLGDVLGGVGAFFGDLAGSDDRKKAMQDLDDARAAWTGVDPKIAAQEAARSGVTAAGAGGRAAQMDALASLQRRYSQGGLDALTRARLARVQTDSANAGRTAAAAALDEANRRGTGGGGNALVNAQLAGQQAANRNAQASLDIAGQGEQLAAGTTRDAGNLSGQMRGQDQDAAAAQDAINRFNASQRQGAAVSSTDNALRKAGGIAGVAKDQYGANMENADRWTRRLAGLGQAAGGVAGYFANPASIADVDQAWKGINDAGGLPGAGGM